jgi:hypothetical protein
MPHFEYNNEIQFQDVSSDLVHQNDINSSGQLQNACNSYAESDILRLRKVRNYTKLKLALSEYVSFYEYITANSSWWTGILDGGSLEQIPNIRI